MPIAIMATPDNLLRSHALRDHRAARLIDADLNLTGKRQGDFLFFGRGHPPHALTTTPSRSPRKSISEVSGQSQRVLPGLDALAEPAFNALLNLEPAEKWTRTSEPPR